MAAQMAEHVLGPQETRVGGLGLREWSPAECHASAQSYSKENARGQLKESA